MHGTNKIVVYASICACLLLVAQAGPRQRRPRPAQSAERAQPERPAAPADPLSQIAAANLLSLPPRQAEVRKKWNKDRRLVDPYSGLTAMEELLARKEPVVVRQRSFAIITEAEQHLGATPGGSQPAILDKTTIDDLNLVMGSKDHPGINLASILGAGARTDLGRAYLTSLIARPTDQVGLLVQRQNLIRAFTQLSEADRSVLVDSLKAFDANENSLIGLWGENLPQLFPQKDYFTSVGAWYLNESSLALQGKAYLNQLKAASSEGMKALSAGLLMVYGLATFLEVEAPYHEQLGSYSDRNLGTLMGRGMGLTVPREMASALTYLEQPQIRGAMMAGVGYNAAKMLKTSIQSHHAELLQHDLLRKRVIHIAQLLEAMDRIRLVLREHPAISDHLRFYQGMEAFFTQLPEDQPKIARLFELLKTSTFSSEPDEVRRYTFNYGRVLVAIKLLTEIEEHLATPLALVGEVDNYLTLAELVAPAEPGQPSFCFPVYLDRPRPSLAATEVWNPFVAPEKVVANSILLDDEHGQNMILTGPNSSGKSTILKSLAIALVLGESASIAPAGGLSYTPLANISTYMNVTDNTIDHESLFQAEAKRVFTYGDMVKQLHERNAFSFAIFDEIFSGTTPEEATRLAEKVARALAEYGNNISIIATHFKQLARGLEAETGGRFRCYKTSVSLGPDGGISRSYRLEPGISDQHIAESVFREKGLDSQFFRDLTENAQ